MAEGGQHGVAASAGSGDQAVGARLEAVNQRRRGRNSDAGHIRRPLLGLVAIEDLAIRLLVAQVAGAVSDSKARIEAGDPWRDEPAVDQARGWTAKATRH